MSLSRLVCVGFGAVLTLAAHGQQTTTGTRYIQFGAIVTDKSGKDIADLDEKDFTVLDGKATKPLTSFKAKSITHDPPHVVIVIDEVNTRFTTNAFVRQELQKYLHTNNGHLAAPTTVATLSYQVLQYHPNFTQDGVALGDAVEKSAAGLRQGATNTGGGGVDEDSVQKSLAGLHQLTNQLASIPGRKIVLWISPGWPLMNTPGTQIDEKPQQAVFSGIVAITNALRVADVVLYTIYPVSPVESIVQTTNYQDYVKGVPRSTQANFGNLALQVFTLHTGGLALDASNNISGMIAKCLADTDSWYELSFDPGPSEKPNEYHHIQLKVDKPGSVVRTIDGYYTTP